MKKILVFKTSTDATVKKLFQDLVKEDIDCLIQSSQIDRYKKEYPCIHFIDICQEGFYDLPSKVVHRICQKTYDQVYVTFSGTEGHNYGNVMELVDKVDFKNAFFYNCRGDRVAVPKRNVIVDMFCRLYINWIGFVYRLRDGWQDVRNSRLLQ